MTRRVALISSAAGLIAALAVASPALATHVRPNSATPKYDPLVISYKPCTAPAPLAHGGPLPYGSCPPVQESPWLTVGTPDANGLPSAFVGSVRLSLLTGPTSQDIRVVFSMTDVRCTGALAGGAPSVCPGGGLGPYTGSVQIFFSGQISDHCNVPGPPPGPPACPPAPGAAGTGPTMPNVIPFLIGAPCAAGAPGAGSTCAANTTVNSILPNVITKGYRQNIELDQVRVQDGGSDGNVATQFDGEQNFAEAGMFAP